MSHSLLIKGVTSVTDAAGEPTETNREADGSHRSPLSPMSQTSQTLLFDSGGTSSLVWYSGGQSSQSTLCPQCPNRPSPPSPTSGNASPDDVPTVHLSLEESQPSQLEALSCLTT